MSAAHDVCWPISNDVVEQAASSLVPAGGVGLGAVGLVIGVLQPARKSPSRTILLGRNPRRDDQRQSMAVFTLPRLEKA